jgi:O-acetylhomoserine/O-acetylserine sulfhydrylase-like pyridoxal-dependent enzyme
VSHRPVLLHAPPQVLYTEVVSNPTLAVADIAALAALAHAAGAQLVVKREGHARGMMAFMAISCTSSHARYGGTT